jgi:hypothetical protein
LQSIGQALMSMLPDDPEGYLRRLRRPRDEQEPQDAPPATRSDRGGGATGPTQSADEQRGYGRADRVGLDQLLQGSTTPKSR